MLGSASSNSTGGMSTGITTRGKNISHNAVVNSTPRKGRLTNYTDYTSLMHNRSAVAGKARAIDAATAPKNPGTAPNIASRQFNNTTTLRPTGNMFTSVGNQRGTTFGGSHKLMQRIAGPTLNGPGMTAEFKPLLTGKIVGMGPVTSIFDKIGQ